MARPARTPIGGDTDKAKRKRLPIFDKRMRLDFPKDPTKYRLWVTDVKGQVQDYLDSGFRFVLQDEIGWVGEGHIEEGSQMESRVCLNVGRAEHLDNAMAYLMEIDRSEWDEIRAQILEERQEPLRQIKSQHEDMRRSGFYGGMDVKQHKL